MKREKPGPERPEGVESQEKIVTEPHVDVEQGPEKEIEAMVDRVDGIRDPNGVLTEGEYEKKQGLLDTIAAAGRWAGESVRSFAQDERRLLLDAHHKKEATDKEQELLRILLDEHPEFKEYLAGSPEMQQQAARVLFELYRNEDFYDRRERTDWQVSSDIVVSPRYERVGKLGTFKKVADQFTVYSKVRAKNPTGDSAPNTERPELEIDQRKMNFPRGLRTAMTPFIDEPGDALEPVFGLPLPRSKRFLSLEEAQAFKKEQLTLIQNCVELLRPGRIRVLPNKEGSR